MSHLAQSVLAPRPAPAAAAAGKPPAARSQVAEAWRHFRRHRLALVSLIALIAIGLAVIIGPLVIAFDPDRIDFRAKSQPPSWQHPMGTDELGRDQFIRVLDGGRISLAVGLAAVLIAVTLGVVVGGLAGFAGGWVDNLLMRLVDVFYALPGPFVLIILITMIGPSFWTIVIAIGILRWMGTSRLVRASILSLKQRDFVEAARSIGVQNRRRITRHLLPKALSPIIVSATLGIAGAKLTESALSFLGLGFQPPQATWGRKLQEAQRAVINDGQWRRGFFPGLMIFSTVLAVNYVGDGLRDAVDPRRPRQ